MKKNVTSVLCIALLLVAGSAYGETFTRANWNNPETGEAGTYTTAATTAFLEGGGTWKIPDRSGLSVFNRMVVNTPAVPYNGSGSVTIPFNLNQRSRATVVIYEIGSNETGRTGPHGSWIRLVPQAKYVWHSPLTDYERGSNSVTWDGNDWVGNAAGAGNYEYDVIAFNDFEANLVGTGHNAAWGQHSVDTNVDPPETWSPFQETPPNVCYRGTVDIDYIANPTAYELWTITAFDPAEQSNASGNRPDDVDPMVHWTSRSSANEELGTIAGVMKLKRNNAAKTLDLDESFGDNGRADVRGSNWWVIPHRQNVYSGVRHGDPVIAAVDVYDKTSGDLVKSLDVLEWFHRFATDEDGNEVLDRTGVSIFMVNDHGIWMTDHSTDHYVRTDLEGNVRWVNTTGDGINDWLSAEAAAELGIASHAAGSNAVTVGMDASPTGKMAIAIDQHNQLGYNFAAFGRDGTGLFQHAFDPALGPYFYGSTFKHIRLIGDGSGRYDGMYPAPGVDITNPTEQASEGTGMITYVPYGIFTGTMGVITAVEEAGSAGTPDSYSLSDAYPNPFNPETTIEFAVPADGRVRIEVYNVTGQVVASLVDEELSAGSYKMTWAGLTGEGEKVSAGVYFYRMQAGEFTGTRSMTLLK